MTCEYMQYRPVPYFPDPSRPVLACPVVRKWKLPHIVRERAERNFENSHFHFFSKKKHDVKWALLFSSFEFAIAENRTLSETCATTGGI